MLWSVLYGSFSKIFLGGLNGYHGDQDDGAGVKMCANVKSKCHLINMRKITPERACSSSITKVENQSFKFDGGTHIGYLKITNIQ